METPVKILVVEDEEILRECLVMFLEQRGYRVTACADLASAMKSIGHDVFDIIITDLNFPTRMSDNDKPTWMKTGGRVQSLPGGAMFLYHVLSDEKGLNRNAAMIMTTSQPGVWKTICEDLKTAFSEMGEDIDSIRLNEKRLNGLESTRDVVKIVDCLVGDRLGQTATAAASRGSLLEAAPGA
jgi:CheY-like chemotaxis protein